MSNFAQRYKEKKLGFGDAAKNRIIRAKERENLRKERRNISFNQGRNISISESSKSGNEGAQAAPMAEDRLTRLKKWKVERDRHKKIEQMRKRPPFVVGVVHHKLYSPISNDPTLGSNVKQEKVRNQPASKATASPIRRVTRATQKRLLKKALAAKTTNNADNNQKPINKEPKSEKKQKQSFAPIDHKFKAPSGLQHIPLFGRVAIQSISPARMSRLLSSPFKMPGVSNRSGTAEFTVEKINDKEDNIPAIIKQKDEEELEESMIEPVSLKLSSDEGNETFTYENNSDGNVSDTKVNVQDNSIRNNSITETVSLKKNVSISTPNNSHVEPAAYSPYVVSSRGKSNARKEQQIKRGFSLNRSQLDDIPTKDTIMKTLNISVEEEERTAQYFRFLLNKEIERLNELCEKWINVKEDVTTSEDGQYEINQAIGQTNLLINKKFERFRGLVADCETGKGEMLVTCRDLQGFWDMMYMEVKDCHTRFEKLEKLRSQDWVEEQSPVPKIVPANKKKTAARKKVAPTKVSSLRTFLAEKKKNVTQQKRNNDNVEESDIVENENSHDKNDSNASRNSRRSTMLLSSNKKCTPVKQVKTRVSLLQMAQSSAASKSIKSPLTVMKVSQMCKTPDVVSYFNSNQTPGKSILKHPKNSVEAELPVKPTSKVNFDDDVVLNEIPVDEEARMKTDLSAALSRIDSFDFNSPDEVWINAEKKLTFDDSGSEEAEDDIKQNFELTNATEKRLFPVPIIKIQSATPSESIRSSGTLSPGSLRRQNAIDKSDEELDNNLILQVNLTRHDETFEYKDRSRSKQKSQKRVSVHDKEELSGHDKEDVSGHDESVRVLRNRIVTAADTPRPRRSHRKASINAQEFEQKENKTPVKTRRKSSVKIPLADKEREDLQYSMDKISLNETKDKRKSRRSVKFSEDCTGCVVTKPPLPMTPHVNRHKSKSTEKKRSTINEDVIACETPETRPDRVRRSRSKKMEPQT